MLLALAVAAAMPVHGGSDHAFIDRNPARALLQSGTSCPNQIPGCMPRRCTTRTVDNVKDRYVCLRCKQGFVPVLSSNRKSIIQCSECLYQLTNGCWLIKVGRFNVTNTIYLNQMLQARCHQVTQY
jgi:DNA-directed RNA polymerase subunit RPC12/RpoP